MRGVFDAFSNTQHDQREFEQRAHDQDAHEERHDSRDEIDQSLRGRLLITNHDASHDRDSAENDGEHI